MALLVYADADGVERQITVGPDPVTVGRSPECVIVSSDPRMSRNHARFFLDPYGTLHVEDLGSSNGVWIGQNKVQTSPVPTNELVIVGSVVFRLMQSQPAPIQKVEWNQPETQPAAPPWQQPQGGAPYGQQGYPQGYGAPPQNAPAAAPYSQPMTPPPPAPPPPAPPPPLFGAATPPPAPDASGELLEAERKARQAAEEERDAYGARMSQLHGELRTLKSQVDASTAEVAALKAQLATNPAASSASSAEVAALKAQLATAQAATAEIAALKTQLTATQQELAKARAAAASPDIADKLQQLDDERARLAVDLEMERDRANASDARLRSAEEELEVARADVMKAEDRIISEVRAHEERAGTELRMRMEELEVARADVAKAEERILDLSRTVSDLETKVRDLEGKLSGRLD